MGNSAGHCARSGMSSRGCFMAHFEIAMNEDVEVSLRGLRALHAMFLGGAKAAGKRADHFREKGIEYAAPRWAGRRERKALLWEKKAFARVEREEDLEECCEEMAYAISYLADYVLGRLPDEEATDERIRWKLHDVEMDCRRMDGETQEECLRRLGLI